jgi:hypothetical protein
MRSRQASSRSERGPAGYSRRLSIIITGGWLDGRDERRPGRELPETPRLTAMHYDPTVCPRAELRCDRHPWVAGLVMEDSSAADAAARYSTVLDVIGLRTAISTSERRRAG